MMRGSGGLHRQSLRELARVVQAAAGEPPESWELDVPGYSETGIGAVLALSNGSRTPAHFAASPVLVSKTMPGVFGCVPAFDRFFRTGSGGAELDRETLTEISDSYRNHKSTLGSVHVPAINFLTEKDTSRRYTKTKIIDMIFFEEGCRRTGRARL
jgi:hypothetical protein